MAHNLDKHKTEGRHTGKKVKLVFAEDLFQSATAEATQKGQTLEEWLLSLVEQHLLELPHQGKAAVQPLDWGRIDSRIDQRTIFLERRIDVLAERIDQLVKQQPQPQSELNSVC
jgi:hypothetical protein